MVNKVIVITGVSSGIGMAFVLECIKSLKEKELIVGLGRTNIPNFSHKNYAYIKTDLSKLESINEAIRVVKSNYGRVDVLINNAGIGYKGSIEELSLTEIRQQFEVNLFGLISVVKLVLPIMRKQQSGHIINISSVGATVSTPTLGYYAATKAALDKISEVLAQEVNKFNIKISIFVPGAVKSSFGKNMKFAKNNSIGIYSELYKEWDTRFRYFFRKRNTSEEAAIALLKLIYSQKRITYLNKKDMLMCWLKGSLPHTFFQFLFLNYYYKYESN